MHLSAASTLPNLDICVFNRSGVQGKANTTHRTKPYPLKPMNMSQYDVKQGVVCTMAHVWNEMEMADANKGILTMAYR